MVADELPATVEIGSAKEQAGQAIALLFGLCSLTLRSQGVGCAAVMEQPCSHQELLVAADYDCIVHWQLLEAPAQARHRMCL